LPTPLKEYVQQVLSEHNRGAEIREALLYGADALKQQADNGWWRRKSTRRALLWENAVARLLDLVSDDRAVVPVPHYDTVSFVYEDAVLVRLKKADYSLHSSNYPTPTADLFHDHQTDLFGHPGLQRVEAVYVPNRFDTEIDWVGVVARQNKALLWNFELTEPAATPVVVLPTPAQPPPATLVKLKDQTRDRNRKKDEK
jgi:hypothetical protein